MQIDKAISDLAEYLLLNGINSEFRQKAKEITPLINTVNPRDLAKLLHNPPDEPSFYTVEKYGLGGWLSACQYAIFEIVYNLGEPALPFIREVAWGIYDWTQGNAIELLIRFASKGIQTENIVAEIKEKYPHIRYEAQLYAIQPLVNKLKTDRSFREIFDRLFEIEDFKDAYDEITYVDPDPHNVFRENLRGEIDSSSKIQERIFKQTVIAALQLKNFKYGSFSKGDGKVRVGITKNCEIFKLEGEEVLSATLDEILSAKVVAVGHWSSRHTDTQPVSIYPRAVTKIE